jgi:hypothetical protein
MAQNSSSVASGDTHKKDIWKNSYEDILLFSEKPTSYLIVALGHKKTTPGWRHYIYTY